MFTGTKSHRCTNFIRKSLNFCAAKLDGRTRIGLGLEVKTRIRVNSSSRSAPWTRVGESMVESMVESMGKKKAKKGQRSSAQNGQSGQK